MIITTSHSDRSPPAKESRSKKSKSKSTTRKISLSARPDPAPAGSSTVASSDRFRFRITGALALLCLLFHPLWVFAQASPFQTGATALQTNLLTIMTPIAIILIIALGVAAMVNRISWGWCAAAVAGIAIAFGAPQMVTWVRGMFGV